MLLSLIIYISSSWFHVYTRHCLNHRLGTTSIYKYCKDLYESMRDECVLDTRVIARNRFP